MTTVLTSRDEALRDGLKDAASNADRVRRWAAWIAAWVRLECPEVRCGGPLPPASDKSDAAEKARAQAREALLTCDREQVEAVYAAMASGVPENELPHGLIGQIVSPMLDRLMMAGDVERGSYKGYAFPFRDQPSVPARRVLTQKEAQEELELQKVRMRVLPPLPGRKN